MSSLSAQQRKECALLFAQQLNLGINCCGYPQINTLSQAIDIYYTILQTGLVLGVGISFANPPNTGLVFIVMPSSGASTTQIIMENMPQPKLQMYRMVCIVNMVKERMLRTMTSLDDDVIDDDVWPQLRQHAQALCDSLAAEPTFAQCEEILQTAPAVVWSRHGITPLDKEPVLPHEFDAAFAAGGFTCNYELRQLHTAPNIFCAGAKDGHEDEWNANEEEFVNGTIHAQQVLHIESIIKGPMIIGSV